MDKQSVANAFLEHLKRELEAIEAAARATYEGAVHAESVAEDKYDTRGLEASYLAGAQANRVREIRATIGVVRTTSVEPLRDTDRIRPGALVELEDDRGEASWVWLVLSGGGESVAVDGATVRLITPQSPLGGELVGREVGDDFELDLPGGIRSYAIQSVR